MKIGIFGGRGQLGQALQKKANKFPDFRLAIANRPDWDITLRKTVESFVEIENPDVLINVAAYTNVDGCVKEPETAARINGLGPQNLAQVCLEANIPLVHVSTNEVFDGTRRDGYAEWMPLNPINPYGASKAAGEFNVRSILPQHYIVRTAWLYSAQGRNFIHAILRRAREHGEIRVVTDEIGNPTWVNDVAEGIFQLIQTGQYGTYHFANEGICSRWEFANEILQLAQLTNVVNRPILGSEFKRASTPPPFSGLHNQNGRAIGIELRAWKEALAAFFEEHAP